MSSTDKEPGRADRRGDDRRAAEEAFAGEDRRVAQRRSGLDRRNAPRVRLQD